MPAASVDDLLRPWWERLEDDLPGLAPFDAHTHVGQNDPDGFRSSAGELTASLAEIDARAAVFPMHEPDGYSAANDRVLLEAEASGGRLVPFCRLDPHAEPVREAERCLAAGARGIKLHPRAERFGLADRDAGGIFALAAERQVPVLVHAGRGIPALGRDALTICERHPGVRLILAHAGISDLGWIWRRLDDHPHLYFDTAWWSAADLLALFALVPPGRILWASDAPYGTPLEAAVMTLRCGLQAGLRPEQAAGVLGGQMERLTSGGEPLALGPPLGTGRMRVDVLLQRVEAFLVVAVNRLLHGEEAAEPLALARLACEVGEEAPQAAVCRSVLALLDRRERLAAQGESGTPQAPGVHLAVIAAAVTRTPDVPLPDCPEPVEVGARSAQL